MTATSTSKAADWLADAQPDPGHTRRVLADPGVGVTR